MHTWLPDAHSEAPAPVSALMSGVLLSVGVYALLRFKPVVDLAAGPAFARRIPLALGLASMAVAALFLWTSQHFKRMLAYPNDADDAPRRSGAASRARVTGRVAGGPRTRGAPAARAHWPRVASRPRPGTRPDRGRGGRLRWRAWRPMR